MRRKTLASAALRRWLAETNQRQADLMRLSGISQQTLCHIMAGRRFPNRHQAFVLSRLTGIPVEHLMDPKRIVVVHAASDGD